MGWESLLEVIPQFVVCTRRGAQNKGRGEA